MKQTKRELFLRHNVQISLWLAHSDYKLWIKPANNTEFHEVISMEYLMQHISAHCDLVCYPTRPVCMALGKTGSVIAPIDKDTVLGETIETVYTPMLNLSKEIDDHYDFYGVIKVSSLQYTELLNKGMLFLRAKDAIKVAKAFRKIFRK